MTDETRKGFSGIVLFWAVLGSLAIGALVGGAVVLVVESSSDDSPETIVAEIEEEESEPAKTRTRVEEREPTPECPFRMEDDTKVYYDDGDLPERCFAQVADYGRQVHLTNGSYVSFYAIYADGRTGMAGPSPSCNVTSNYRLTVSGMAVAVHYEGRLCYDHVVTADLESLGALVVANAQAYVNGRLFYSLGTYIPR